MNRLNYIGSQSSYNWLLILAILAMLQWIITVYLVYKKDKDLKLCSTKYMKEKEKNYSKYICFESDYFYWFWNIFPIIFYAHFLYIEYSWEVWLRSLFLLDIDHTIKDLYFDLFYSSLSSNIDILIVSLLSMFSIYFGYIGQDKKHKKMNNEKKSLYWWSSTFSYTIYVIRKIFLVFNLILMGFLTYLITKISIFIVMILHLEELNIFPFHVDGYGGFYPIMEITSIIVAMYLLRVSMGIIGLNDHKNHGWSDRLGDILNIIYLPLAIYLFGTMLYSIKQHTSNAYDKFNMTQYLSIEKYQIFIDNFINSTKKEYDISNLNNYYSILVNSAFPVDITLFYNTIFTMVFPISAWFLITNYKEKNNA